MTSNTVLIRYSEIGLKGKNRIHFEHALIDNIATSLEIRKSAILRRRGRILLSTQDLTFSSIREKLKKVFGIHSFSQIHSVSLHAEGICAASLEIFDELRRAMPKSSSFAVKTRRSNKRFPLTSMDLNREIGRRILEHAPDMHVNLDAPDLTLHLEIGSDAAYFLLDAWDGPGGLPVGVGGHVLLLLSGGIDSPVAAWMMMKRGCEFSAIYFHSPPYTGDKVKEKVISLCEILSNHHLKPVKLYVVHFTAVQETIQRDCRPSLSVVLNRRMMHRIAERIALEANIKALVTGENLGQVASQTLDNLCNIDEAVTIPILRPLIAFDKAETIDIAKRIGTFETSTLPYEDCCSLFVPQNPATRTRLKDLKYAETQIDVESLVTDAIRSAQIIEADRKSIRGFQHVLYKEV